MFEKEDQNALPLRQSIKNASDQENANVYPYEDNDDNPMEYKETHERQADNS